ncbi:DnaJ domain-containing protein [[Actinomadura] parvosata]|uniref:DnaJ domain-containing protein n=1 Tax=[Actinomadura] parvosata TaxID=1955412 RepID=UPI00406CC739
MPHLATCQGPARRRRADPPPRTPPPPPRPRQRAGELYERLGVARTATRDEIRKAYRRLAYRLHPDLHPGDTAAAERFKEVTEAYDVLSDPRRRQAYDLSGRRPRPG